MNGAEKGRQLLTFKIYQENVCLKLSLQVVSFMQFTSFRNCVAEVNNKFITITAYKVLNLNV